MVDPKRNINKLTEEDVMFLNELEEESKDRYTENDPEYRAVCEKPVKPPPIVHPWKKSSPYGGGHHGGGYYGGGQRRGGYYNNNRGRPHRGNRYDPYNNSYRDRSYGSRYSGGGGGGGGGDYDRNYRQSYSRR
ncbi:RNA-binding protein cabeza [Sabethes cyaneus]|uniref:RNA-binding protein cabeza n=1 Tax=Sabethes cyaneus TaxID=53552 RepID=UPI00237E712B|nr:RNA-binding protein cabeza [Sabethes cyaneus]